MTDVTVRSLGEEDWQEFRAIRLAALRDSPDAFAASVDAEEGFEEDFWRLRLRRSTRLVAVRREAEGSTVGQSVGVVSLGEGKDEEGRVAEIFGLWVATWVIKDLLSGRSEEWVGTGRQRCPRE